MGALLPAAVERRGGGAAVAARPRLEADGGVVVVLDDAHGGTAEELLQVIRNSTVGEEVSGLDTVHGTFYLLSHSLTYCCACSAVGAMRSMEKALTLAARKDETASSSTGVRCLLTSCLGSSMLCHAVRRAASPCRTCTSREQ